MRGSDPADIGRMLDAGVRGIVLPHVGLDIEATKKAIAALRYAPAGARPTCSGVRAANYGLSNFGSYAERNNAEVLSIGLIEDLDVVENIDQVLEECRLDAVIPGPGDLATSMNVPGQLEHPDVVAAVTRVVTAAKAKEIKVGVYVVSDANLEMWTALGVDFFLVSIDYRILANAYSSKLQELTAVSVP